jgi:hypothetical protein
VSYAMIKCGGGGGEVGRNRSLPNRDLNQVPPKNKSTVIPLHSYVFQSVMHASTTVDLSVDHNSSTLQ